MSKIKQGPSQGFECWGHSPQLRTSVIQEDGSVVEVVTEFDEIAGQSWASLNAAKREEARRLVVEIHNADVEVAVAPRLVRNQLFHTLPDGIEPSHYAETIREYLDAAQQDVAKLGYRL